MTEHFSVSAYPALSGTAMQVHYVPSRRAIHVGLGVGNLINGRTNGGPIIRLSPFPFAFSFATFIRQYTFHFFVLRPPVHYLRFALMYSPLLGPHTRWLFIEPSTSLTSPSQIRPLHRRVCITCRVFICVSSNLKSISVLFR